ncbi:MAG TPA: saccharopine dehydrogenase C-terminal domain-containing protein [Ferrovibrio sp.]|uniref:saccharopine dehydrogenase family protein n=1 Tax=Ferrovibrio sp. TaxID=1917215 RepID=UPI002ED3CFFC
MTAQILIIGAGKIGRTIANMLAQSGDYRVTLADCVLPQLTPGEAAARIEACQLDACDGAALDRLLNGRFAVVSAVPFHVTAGIAAAAADRGVHYLDLTEDVAATQLVKQLAPRARRALIPQCGLAPGFISIVGHHLAQRFDRLDSLRLRTGALPQFPANGLNYNLTWSTEGVINEYCQPCEAIVDGRLVTVPALEEREEFSLDGIRYEAFNTSGGLGTLCETLSGKLRHLNYRSIRYPGHAAAMKLLLQDLRFSERRTQLKEILEQALPATLQDVVVIFATATGYRHGRLVQESYARKIYSREIAGQTLSAIQLTTAAALCAVLDLLREGRVAQQGFVRQEEIGLDVFLANRFGSLYGDQADLPSLAKVA